MSSQYNVPSQYPPWTNLTKDSSGDIIESTGVIFALMNVLAEKLNFTYTVMEPESGRYGVKVNGRWDGMVKLMEEKKVSTKQFFFESWIKRLSFTSFLNLL